MRTLTVIEPHLSGHHAAYLRRILDGAKACGIETRIIHSDAIEAHPEIGPLLSAGSTRFMRVPVEANTRARGPISRRLRQFDYWRYLHTVAQSIEPERELVLLPYADYALYAMALKGSPFRGAPWTGICMRPNFHQRAAGVAGARWGLAPQVQGWLYHRLARDPCLLRLFVIDETFFESSAVGTKLAAKSSLLPEPADDIAAGEDSSYNFGNIAAGDFVILMYGAISERKGLSKLLAALASPSMPPEVKVLISGRQDASARVAIERALLMNPSLRSRIACNDFYHSAVQEATCFMRADVVWLNYEGHLGMSGVLVQAARYQKPVISCADGVLGWHTKRKALGVVLPARAAPEEIAQVVRAMRADESGRVMMGLRGARAFQANSTDDFQWRLFSTLQPLLGEGL